MLPVFSDAAALSSVLDRAIAYADLIQFVCVDPEKAKVSFPRNFVCPGRPKIEVTFGRQEMKRPKQAYTAEFKERAVKRAQEGQSIRAVVKELGLGDQTLRHGIKASAEGQLNGVGAEWSRRTRGNCPRLRAENLRLKRELEIIKKRRRPSPGRFCEGRLDCRARKCVCPGRKVRRARRPPQRLSGREAWRQAGSPAPV